MIRTRLVAALAVLPMAAMTVAAGGDDCRTIGSGADAYQLCTLETYFHQADTKVGNVGGVEDSPLALPSWDTEAPTASVTAGGGGGFASNSLVSQGGAGDAAKAIFEGTYTGVLDSMEVDLHILGESPITAQAYNVELYVDGLIYATGSQVEIISVEEENASAARRLEFAITGLGSALGFEDRTYELRLTVEPTYIINDTAVFVFDTTEVPGGITFNPLTIAPSRAAIPAF